MPRWCDVPAPMQTPCQLGALAWDGALASHWLQLTILEDLRLRAERLDGDHAWRAGSWARRGPGRGNAFRRGAANPTATIHQFTLATLHEPLLLFSSKRPWPRFATCQLTHPAPH